MAGEYDLRRTGVQYYWNLKAANGEVILTSEMYNSRSGAEAGIASVRVNSPLEARYHRLTALSGETYFVLKAGNGEIIGRSETYRSADARESGISSCKANGPAALVEDNA